MAEVLGLVTAIGTMVTTGFKIARAVSGAADDFGSASTKVKCIATDTKAVVMILRQIKSRLATEKSVDSEILEVLARLLTQCKADIDEIDRCLIPLVALTGDSMTIKQRLRWLFAKSKISGKQASLDSLKLTLTLFLHMMDLADGEDIEDLKEEIHNAVDETKRTKIAFLNAERLDRAAAKAYESMETEAEAAQEDDEQSNGNYRDRASIAWDSNPTPASGELIILNRSPEDTHEPRVSAAQKDGLADQQLQLLTASEFDVMEGLSDDEFVNIAEHISLQKAVTSLALLVIHRQAEPEDEPYRGRGNENPTTTATQDKATTGIRESNARSQFTSSDPERTDWLYSSSTEQTAPAEPNESRQQQRDATAPPEERGSHDAGNSFQPAPPFSSYSNPDAGLRTMPRQSPAGWPPFYESAPGQGHNLPPWGYQNMPYPSSTPTPYSHPGYPNPEVEELRSQLSKLLEEKAAREQREKQAEIEARIRKDAERVFARRMEEMRNAQEEAKRDILKAKVEAEKAARERLEAERKADEERKKQHAEAMKKAERDARDKLEAELMAMEERKRREAEQARFAEAAARAKIEAALKAATEARAVAEAKAAEEAEWRKRLEHEAMLKAEIHAREKLERERQAAEDAIEAEKKTAKKKGLNILSR